MAEEALTIRQAATLLGVHANTVRNRIKSGRYQADKVVTEHGETYLIPRSELEGELPANNLVSPPPSQHASQPLPDVREAMQAMLEPFVRELGEVREELGREKERRERAEERIEELERQLEARESPETVEEAPDRGEHRPATGEAQDELGAERLRREVAESTLREGMAEQRRRREAAERERDDLRRELYGLRERTQAPEPADEQQGRGQPRSAAGGAQEGARRPWWRRMLGR